MSRIRIMALLCVDMLIWLLASGFEENSAILVLHVLGLALSALLLAPMGSGAREPWAWGLVLRSLFMVFAWATAADPQRRFYIGTNEDALRFWEAAQGTFEQALQTFEDPFFPVLNYALTTFSAWFAEPNYLATAQSSLMAGAAMVPLTYRFTTDLFDPRTGRLTSYLFAFSPTAITFSTGMMRDSVIGMFGLLFLWSLLRLTRTSRAGSAVGWLLMVTGSGVALSWLRSISLATFLFAGFLVVVLGTRLHPPSLTIRARLMFCAILVTGLLLAILARPDRFAPEHIFLNAVSTLTGEGLLEHSTVLEEDSTIRKIFETSPALFLPLSPLALIMPIPFFAWEPPSFLGGPVANMDIVLGLGALLNQIMFGLYLIGLRQWGTQRDTGALALGGFYTLLFCALTLMTMGHVRVVMAHCLIFYFMSISVGIIALRNFQRGMLCLALTTWSVVLLSVYLMYAVYKYVGSLPLLCVTALVTVICFMWFWQIATPRRYVKPQAHV